jgi:hypothetical protein
MTRDQLRNQDRDRSARCCEVELVDQFQQGR